MVSRFEAINLPRIHTKNVLSILLNKQDMLKYQMAYVLLLSILLTTFKGESSDLTLSPVESYNMHIVQ